MKHVLKRQQHQVEVTFGRQRRMTELSKAARMRLTTWGSCIRTIIYTYGPPGRCLVPDLAKVKDQAADKDLQLFDILNRFTQADETEGWLNEFRDIKPKVYYAVVVRYVARQLGATLDVEEQVKRFQNETGYGRRTYYKYLDIAEQFIAAKILEQENPELFLETFDNRAQILQNWFNLG